MWTASTSFRVLPVPCLKDNYAYLLECQRTHACVVVDPGEAGPVIAALDQAGIVPVAIWCTHHHLDHVAGVEGLLARFPGLHVICSEHDRTQIAHATDGVAEGAHVACGDLWASVLNVPGHTLGAIAFVVAPDGEAGAVFTGDTLFVAGAGRIFEGTPAMMWNSMLRLRALPPTTRVFCGHEYTRNNVAFACSLEPSHIALAAFAHAIANRSCTVPSTIATERALNPFIRCDERAIGDAVGLAASTSAADVLAEVRARKNNFAG